MNGPTIVCIWVKKSWETGKKDTIIKSFKNCGISNAIDGSEDDAAATIVQMK